MSQKIEQLLRDALAAYAIDADELPASEPTTMLSSARQTPRMASGPLRLP